MTNLSVLVQAADGVMVITLNRPERRNAVNGDLARQLRAALDQLDSDDTLRVGVVTGAGGSFCTGLDLKAVADGEDVMTEAVLPHGGFAGIAEALPAKPLIAAVEGFAIAGGLEIALACDLIVAAEDAQFGIPEVKRGLIAGGGALLRLPRQIPQRIAIELALTGAIVPAQKMSQYGLINRVVPKGTALEAALVLAGEITENSPLGVQASKEIIQRSANWTSSEMFERQQAILDTVLASEDVREGAAAFAEKRRPVWRGR